MKVDRMDQKELNITEDQVSCVGFVEWKENSCVLFCSSVNILILN